MPARAPAESWARRRAKYEAWLAEAGSFALIAERAGRAVGYALVRVGAPFDGWGRGERVGVVETLAVVDAERGRGVGGALLDAVEGELAAAGIYELRLTVVAPNRDAQRFYERRGLEPVALTLATARPTRDNEPEPPG